MLGSSGPRRMKFKVNGGKVNGLATKGISGASARIIAHQLVKSTAGPPTLEGPPVSTRTLMMKRCNFGARCEGRACANGRCL